MPTMAVAGPEMSSAPKTAEVHESVKLEILFCF